MSNVKFFGFGRFIDRSIAIVLVGMGVLLAGATALTGA
jgi:hypothetical protein